MNTNINLFLDLPDDLLYGILIYTAPPTDRASILCHTLIPLCSSIQNSINNERQDLWSMVLTEYTNGTTAKRNNFISKKTKSKQIRSSKRLRRNSIKEQVQDSHKLLIDRTFIAYYALDEMVHSSKTPLSLRNLRWIFKNYGPILRCNQYQSPYAMQPSKTIGEQSSGTFLIACCRARHCKENIILNCVKELIEKHGALPNYGSGCNTSLRATQPSSKYSVPFTHKTSPLCIAAARGMVSLVKYLISAGASVHSKGCDKIAMSRKPFHRIKGSFTPYEFAEMMHSNYISFVDLSSPMAKKEVKAFEKCMRILKEAEKI